MKIHQIRFKNLNSLAGEWKIDLDDPNFTAEGIFAITGPTGAGKSTILDAICLALYGQTPRLGKIAGENEIMSRQTGDCFAELTFETQKGLFRCHWSQHRAKGKPKGTLQPAKHELADARSKKVLVSKISEMPAAILDCGGMDFERFTRSILLAQGGFAAFLQAKPDERAPILEQITGTEIYSTISKKVHERFSAEKQRREDLQKEVDSIEILDEETESGLRQELARQEQEKKELEQVVEEDRKKKNWLENLDKLKKDSAALEPELRALADEIRASEPERQKLLPARQAAGLEGRYAELVRLRKEQDNDAKTLSSKEKNCASLELKARELKGKLDFACEQSRQAGDALKNARPTLDQIRKCDLEIKGLKGNLAKAQTELAAAEKELASNQKSVDGAMKKRSGLLGAIRDSEKYLDENRADERLAEEISGLNVQLDSLGAVRQDLARWESKRRDAGKLLEQRNRELATLREKSAQARSGLEDACSRLEQGRNDLAGILQGKSLKEHEDEREVLLQKQAHANTLKSLEQHRAALRDGEPCPLCGAQDHPYARGNMPAFDGIKDAINQLTLLIGKARKQEALVSELEKAEAQAREKLNEVRSQAVAAEDKLKAVMADQEDLDNELDAVRKKLDSLAVDIAARLKPFALTVPEQDLGPLRKSLNARLERWKEHSARQEEHKLKLGEIDSQLIELRAFLEKGGEAVQTCKARLDEASTCLEQKTGERSAQYGDLDPDAEEARLNAVLERSRVAETSIREDHAAADRNLSGEKKAIEDLRNRLAGRTAELETLGKAFATALAETGFPDEAGFLQARLEPGELRRIEARARKLETRKTELQTRAEEAKKRLEAEAALKLTELPLVELMNRLDADSGKLKALTASIVELDLRLKGNAEKLERIKDKKAALDRQKAELKKWDYLETLIGSHDGKKFRNFAQGLTFERLVSLANAQLERMDNRYRLKRDEKERLNLNVIDTWQANEVRVTKNLSGGESFIISLALALALSGMSSRTVQVDSLFLDEGFGSLDEDSLATALDTLASLRKEGKLIGLISHVPALKERIATQIEVIPGRNARSRLSGPGCSEG